MCVKVAVSLAFACVSRDRQYIAYKAHTNTHTRQHECSIPSHIRLLFCTHIRSHFSSSKTHIIAGIRVSSEIGYITMIACYFSGVCSLVCQHANRFLTAAYVHTRYTHVHTAHDDAHLRFQNRQIETTTSNYSLYAYCSHCRSPFVADDRGPQRCRNCCCSTAR